MIKITTETQSLRIFRLSFFLPAVSRSMSLYLEMEMVLKIITKRKIRPKYRMERMSASMEKVNSNCLRLTANILAVTTASP